MYGVIVVPTTATISSRTLPDRPPRLGEIRAWPTWPQSGWARKAEKMYVTKTRAIARKTRSTVR